MVPDVGRRDDAHCTCTGDAIFARTKNPSQMKLNVKCSDKAPKVEGNMHWSTGRLAATGCRSVI